MSGEIAKGLASLGCLIVLAPVIIVLIIILYAITSAITGGS